MTRTGFEPATNPSLERMRLPSMLRHRVIKIGRDSRDWTCDILHMRQMFYRWTISLNLAGVIGFEPMMAISKTAALGQLGDTPINKLHFGCGWVQINNKYVRPKMYIETLSRFIFPFPTPWTRMLQYDEFFYSQQSKPSSPPPVSPCFKCGVRPRCDTLYFPLRNFVVAA